ncbi:hypothetical protein DICVIV_00233 [Dictyocaulus viviparus]|uniref:Uncharacterized protein n=1 Tax=Dictyocaulus viviparus TaxID=29172 RepID=A0A0D8Y9R2_DICVI|nr:hypothetical protein DICVIV_00233 [Dictyocaulus viviparus]
MFNQHSGSPFDDPFFRGTISLIEKFQLSYKFATFMIILQRIQAVHNRLISDRPRFLHTDLFNHLSPIRGLTSNEDKLRGIVRNIPICVEGIEPKDISGSDPGLYNTSGYQRRYSESGPLDYHKKLSSGRFSPTDDRKFVAYTKNSLQPLTSSDEEERRSVCSDIVTPQRTLIIPTSVPGKTIAIPLGNVSLTSSQQDLNHPRHRSPKPGSQMEKLTQRLKNLGKHYLFMFTNFLNNLMNTLVHVDDDEFRNF